MSQTTALVITMVRWSHNKSAKIRQFPLMCFLLAFGGVR
jgi:hypothetical protein